ncbi:MAG: phosphoribosylamine--glycine ligase, partial [bacterium]|nr:phosphoribosylamine--glycine ligase [bacterium]
MKVMVLGGGAREHALAWHISQSPKCTGLFVAPGNAGTGGIAQNVQLEDRDPIRMAEQIADLGIAFVVVGPESFLELGLVDALRAKGILAFGPTRAAARLETSKAFAMEVMERAGVPHPDFRILNTAEEVKTFVGQRGKPVVVKADGLAGGRGVHLCNTTEEAYEAARVLIRQPDGPVVVQELLSGREVSVFAFTDGHHLSPLVAACDYKRLWDGDKGPNTGGMGSYAWPEFWDEALDLEIRTSVMEPVLAEMERLGTPFAGMLYAGIMLTQEGPKVLEFNARFGDPEAQVILQLLENDLLKVFLACARGNLQDVPVSWDQERSVVGVVLASSGYPGEHESGAPISGLRWRDKDTIVFHASTQESDGEFVTGEVSGRILTVVGSGSSLTEARERAYDRAKKIHFPTAV